MFTDVLTHSLLDQREDLALALASPHLQQGTYFLALLAGTLAEVLLKMYAGSTSLTVGNPGYFGAKSIGIFGFASLFGSMIGPIPLVVPLLVITTAFMLMVGCIIGSGLGGLAVRAKMKTDRSHMRPSRKMQTRQGLAAPLLLVLTSKARRRLVSYALGYGMVFCYFVFFISSVKDMIAAIGLMIVIAFVLSPFPVMQRRKAARRLYRWMNNGQTQTPSTFA